MLVVADADESGGVVPAVVEAVRAVVRANGVCVAELAQPPIVATTSATAAARSRPGFTHSVLTAQMRPGVAFRQIHSYWGSMWITRQRGASMKRVMSAFSAAALCVGLAVFAITVSPAAFAASLAPAAPVVGPPGYAMSEPVRGAAAPRTASPAKINASYTHSPAVDSGHDLPPGNGDVMTSTTIYLDFWLPAGQTFESTAAGNTNYENLIKQWASDLGGSQFHNLLTQYYGNNGSISNNVTFGGSWVDTTNAYPHAGTSADPLTDDDVQAEVTNAVTTNGWTEDTNHIVAVFTATGIQECGRGSECTYTDPGFCAYHDHFSDSGNDTVYAYMSYDDFTHLAGKTCVAGTTGGDNDPNRSTYPNGDRAADSEISTLSHEVIEAETDPHPNDTWTNSDPNVGEIGDACNFNYAPRDDTGADVYMNGHGYIMQQEYSNAAHTCAVDLPTNGFCAGSVSNVCAPTVTFGKTVDNPNPRVDSTITYTITAHNTNDTAADTNASVTDTVPAGYTVTGLSAPNATSSTFDTHSVTVNYDYLAVHTTRTITVTASVPEQAGTAATNCGALGGQDLIGTALASATTNPCATTTPVKIPTQIVYTGPASGDYHDPATVSAVLTDDGHTPLAGKTLTFTLNNAETCSAVTDGTGTASCDITPQEAAASYPLKVEFSDASDPVYAVSSTTTSFEVTKEETTTTYTGPTVVLAGGSGVTLSGQLLEDGTTPIAGRTLTLALGAQTCSAGPTDVLGNAHCTLTFTGALGPEPVSASFAGDGYYQQSSDTGKSVTVFAFPSRGAFTLGDVTTATAGSSPVTWWADNWYQLNTLTGGTAPSSFKGFAGTVSLPTSTPPASCGGNWKTLPGNSPPPAAGVPSYMGVLVTSSVKKSGNGIAGNTVHIVVVKTNSGYSPSPANHGTGTIVATYC